VVQLLRDVLVNGRSVDTIADNPALKFCYKMGWLQAELEYQPESYSKVKTSDPLLLATRTVYVFPTRIHERCDLFDVYYYRC
jgi:hypothetical protein